VNKHLYLCHLLVLSSPTLMTHGHTNLKFTQILNFMKTRAVGAELFHADGHDAGHFSKFCERWSVVIMLYCYCVALLLFVLSYVLIVCTVPLPPCVNPIAVDKYINIS